MRGVKLIGRMWIQQKYGQNGQWCTDEVKYLSEFGELAGPYGHP